MKRERNNATSGLLGRAAWLATFAGCLCFLFAGLPFTAAAGEAVMTQRIPLYPGWNAVYLEVQPDPNDIETVFAGIPVESVWRWIPRGVTQPDFVQDPAEGLQTINGWYGYFPQPRPEAFLTNLFTVRGNQAYLVKLGGSQVINLEVTGKPKLRAQQWRSNGFSLVGFSVDPASPPTFGDYFAPSPAHAGQPVYRLNAQGYWELVTQPFATSIVSGAAYWVYTQGSSDYQGPLKVNLEYGDSLEYTASLTNQRVVVENLAGAPVALAISGIEDGGAALPLLYENIDPETDEHSWPALRNVLVSHAEVKGGVFWNLAVNRAAFVEDRMEQIFAITNGLGSRILVHAGANTIQPLAPPPARPGGTRAASGAIHPQAGLWLGVASVDAVSEAQMAGTLPEPTGRSFPLRVLLHIDSSGKARLLKDVVQMWEDGTYKPSAIDPQKLEVDVPGRYLLVTDADLIPSYSGAEMRDGTPVGIRYSTVAYDFTEQYLPLAPDTFSIPGSFSLTLRADPQDPTNPFKHKYHPDHDNLDRQFLNFSPEAYEVTRAMTFQFTADDPSGRNPPDWGDSIIGGWYRETITGLHRNAIFVEGELRLKRVSAVSTLNQ